MCARSALLGPALLVLVVEGDVDRGEGRAGGEGLCLDGPAEVIVAAGDPERVKDAIQSTLNGLDSCILGRARGAGWEVKAGSEGDVSRRLGRSGPADHARFEPVEVDAASRARNPVDLAEPGIVREPPRGGQAVQAPAHRSPG